MDFTEQTLKPMVKKIPHLFIELDGEEFLAQDVLRAIEDMLETHEDDHYGDYSLHDYELRSDETIYNIFVKLGMVRNYTGSRMANLYCMAKGGEDELRNLRDCIYTLYPKFREELKEQYYDES